MRKNHNSKEMQELTDLKVSNHQSIEKTTSMNLTPHTAFNNFKEEGNLSIKKSYE